MSIPGREAGPADADLGLSCGAPLGFLDLRPGETVLDLGSGSGIDAFLAARAVAPKGRAIGVDMTPEMVERSQAIALREGIENVEFRVGRLEALPLPDASVDAVTSNCVLNLVPDKEAVAREIARVLRPGGRLVISDILLAAPLPAALEADMLAHVGCIAGAELREDCFSRLRAAGFSVEVLSDVDAGSSLDAEGAEEVSGVLERLGIRPEQVAGLVRSVTYRARRAG